MVRSDSLHETDTVPGLIERKRVPEAPSVLPPQMTAKRIPPAERRLAAPDHEHPLELERLLVDDLLRHAMLARIEDGHAAAHPLRHPGRPDVRRDVPLEVGRAVVVLDVRAVRAPPAVRAHRGGVYGRGSERGRDLDVASFVRRELGLRRLWRG